MAGRATLYVEGNNDVHTIIHLLARHDVKLDMFSPDLDTPIIASSNTGEGGDGGDSHLIQTLSSLVNLAERPIGFVFDADASVGVKARWDSVRHQLRRSEVPVPAKMPSEGFIGSSPVFKVNVGVWLMPDNQRSGSLETFLCDLIDDKDSLFKFAKESTDQAMKIGSRFSESSRSKAELYAWLAWQSEPGRPYGTAIKAKYFEMDSPAALAFVGWFRRLFQLSD